LSFFREGGEARAQGGLCQYFPVSKAARQQGKAFGAADCRLYGHLCRPFRQNALICLFSLLGICGKSDESIAENQGYTTDE
jgi:hypothetical protein